MATVNSKGYILVRSRSRKCGGTTASYRRFWIGRKDIALRLSLPGRYWGKRIAFRIEELDAPGGQ